MADSNVSFLGKTPYREVLRRLTVWEIVFLVALADAFLIKLVI